MPEGTYRDNPGTFGSLARGNPGDIIDSFLEVQAVPSNSRSFRPTSG